MTEALNVTRARTPEPTVSRRAILAAVPAAIGAAALPLSYGQATGDTAGGGDLPLTPPAAAGVKGAVPAPTQPWFPSQDPQRVREMVGVAHRNLKRVRELLEASPALAKATWDWGFGDWETALGAASHVGNRDIANVLIAHGARPDIFTFAMLGQLEVVKAYIGANPGIQRTAGPHGITLLKHAQAGGEQAAAVLDYLKELGEADPAPSSSTLSEAEQRAYIGSYGFGPGADDFVQVQTARDGLLAIRRGASGTPCKLFYLDDHTFHPAGAPAVRIRFNVAAERADALRVFDPDVIIAASVRPG